MMNTDIRYRVPPTGQFQVLQSQFSPGTAYYLRRLLRKNLDRLLTANADPINVSLLNDLEGLVQSAAGASAVAVLQELEQLVQRHQSLSNQGLKRRRDLRTTEQRIVSLLGLSLKDVNQQATLLIVDDTPDNLRLLSTALSDHGYAVRSAINGALAINSAQIIKPDLILLDIMMPGLDGYEVCKRLKADPKTSDIPIIFISALNDGIDKVKAFSVGGVDYITKPVQIDEVLARIQHQIKIWNLQKRLEDQSLRLQEEISQRQQADARSRQLFEKAVSGVYRLGPDGKFLAVSEGMAQLYGYESPEAMMATATAQTLYVNPRQYSEFINRIQVGDLLTGFESEIRRPDETSLWVTETVRALRDDLRNLLYYEGTVTDISDRKKAEDKSRRSLRHSQKLLLSLFPRPIAERVSKKPDRAVIDQYDNATILFADVVGLDALAQTMPSSDFLKFINQIFVGFNRLADKFHVEPIKTLGTSYVAIAGVPTPTPNHALAMAEFALRLQNSMSKYRTQEQALTLRIGIHSGPVLAGIIGPKRLSYDIWGDTVTTAQCLEQEGTNNNIQISSTTYELVKSHYACKQGGQIDIAGGRRLLTYWLQSR
ncbi:MAG: adenylate/guanylate cyclase domain-containing protein [Cyanobacteria bacterium P01_D01_bin.115]